MPYASKEQQREYQRQWMARRREDFFKDKQCVRCGSTESLELDHIDRAEKVSHRIWSWSQVRREAEIAKCQVLCEGCHQIKTNEDFGWGQREHGTVAKYNKDDCRCRDCKDAIVIHWREYRARKK